MIADTLSKAFSPKKVANTTESEVNIRVCTVRSGLPVSERKWADIAEATENEEELQRVVRRMTDKTVTCSTKGAPQQRTLVGNRRKVSANSSWNYDTARPYGRTSDRTRDNYDQCIYEGSADGSRRVYI